MDYSDEVRARFADTAAAGGLDPGLPGRVVGEAEDRSLSVWVRFELQVVDGRVRAARFQAFGCPHTIAAASWVAEWIRDRGVESLLRLDVPALAERLAVPTEKLGKLLRVEDALADCARRLGEMNTSAAAAVASDRLGKESGNGSVTDA